jgi:hypothetical protein
MFKDGRAGATSCTNELVEEMVRKADKPGQEGKIFR